MLVNLCQKRVLVTNELVEIVDQDELQLKDEMNREWVESWKKHLGE